MTKMDKFSAALKHVVEKIFKEDENSILMSALTYQGITNMDNLIMDERDYKQDPIAYTNSNGKTFEIFAYG